MLEAFSLFRILSHAAMIAQRGMRHHLSDAVTLRPGKCDSISEMVSQTAVQGVTASLRWGAKPVYRNNPHTLERGKTDQGQRRAPPEVCGLFHRRLLAPSCKYVILV